MMIRTSKESECVSKPDDEVRARWVDRDAERRLVELLQDHHLLLFIVPYSHESIRSARHH